MTNHVKGLYLPQYPSGHTVRLSVSPVHSLDNGVCHKCKLLKAGWSVLWLGETNRWCIEWPAGSPFVGSSPMHR